MTISINRTISVKDTNGHLIQVNGEESLITKSEITLACSGPNCAKRNGKIVSTTFIEEELQANPDSASSTFRRFGQWKFNLAVKEFCSLECAEDILRAAELTTFASSVLEKPLPPTNGQVFETVDGGQLTAAEIQRPELALRKACEEILASEDKILSNARKLVQKMDDSPANQGISGYKNHEGEPTAEDLDKAVTEIIPGVTATVEV